MLYMYVCPNATSHKPYFNTPVLGPVPLSLARGTCTLYQLTPTPPKMRPPSRGSAIEGPPLITINFNTSSPQSACTSMGRPTMETNAIVHHFYQMETNATIFHRRRRRRSRPCSSFVSVVATIVACVSSAQAKQKQVTCPAPPKAGAECTEVNTFEQLRQVIGGAAGPRRVDLCPFSIAPSVDAPIRVQRRVVIACHKKEDDDKCIIRGAGPHVEISGRRSGVVLQGMTFRGAGSAGEDETSGPAVMVKKSKRRHMICACEFVNNRRAAGSGGAIVASSRTKLFIFSSTFTNNFSPNGGAAVYLGRSSSVRIYGSKFSYNEAKSSGVYGASVRASGTAKLYMEGTAVESNQFKSPSIAVGSGDYQWTDGGRNRLVWTEERDVLCGGIYVYPQGACMPFIGQNPQVILNIKTANPKRIFVQGDELNVLVGFSNINAKSKDYVAIAPSGIVDSSSYFYTDQAVAMRKLCGSETCTQTMPYGWMEFKNNDVQAMSGEFKAYLLTSFFSGVNVPYTVLAESDPFVIKPPPFRAFDPGPITKYDRTTGLKVAQNVNVRLVAESGRRVRYTSQEARSYESSISFHGEPDGAAIFPLSGGGYVYMSNSELPDRRGGVYAIEFDSNGKVKNYDQKLSGTTYNCSGGKTSWGTYISCEEHSRGVCWQIHPEGQRAPEVTNLGEPEGGNFEAVAYDDRNPRRPCFFLTEDHPFGALRRFCPDSSSIYSEWEMLHGPGRRTYLEIYSGNRFGWTSDINAGRRTANQYFPGAEGITHDGKGLLYVVSKTRRTLYVFNLNTLRYKSESTNRGLFNGGSFEAEPDQVTMYGPNDRYQFITEDGGPTAGLYAREVATGNKYTLFYTNDSRFNNDEVTGVAMSPDGKFLYACVQQRGYFLELTRTDGERFEGRTVLLKYHRRDNGGVDNVFDAERRDLKAPLE